jgi:Mlc titration factor MtfA (ptsG expression regulator)
VFGRFRRDPTPLTPAERNVLTHRVRSRLGLDDTDADRHADLTADLLGRWTWEAARGFDLTDDVRVTVAGSAALLVLGLDDPDPYRRVRAVVVHGGGMTLRGPRPGPSLGVVTEAPRHVDGHTTDRGPVFVSWRAARRDLDRPERGHNVVLHEFAHRLDMLDGVVDGTPPMAAPKREVWAAVCTRHYDAVRAGAGPRDPDDRPLLRRYAGTGVGEFFAVATEVFFTRPAALRAAAGDLYRVLADYYGQDPADRAVPAARPE